MGMQDRLYDVLQTGALAYDLIAPGHLPAERLGRLVGYPGLGQKAAGMQPGQHRRVDLVGLDPGVGDETHLPCVGDNHACHMGTKTLGYRHGIARRLHHHFIGGTKCPRKRIDVPLGNLHAAFVLNHAVLQHRHLGKGAMDVQSDNTHDAVPPRS